MRQNRDPLFRGLRQFSQSILSMFLVRTETRFSGDYDAFSMAFVFSISQNRDPLFRGLRRRTPANMPRNECQNRDPLFRGLRPNRAHHPHPRPVRTETRFSGDYDRFASSIVRPLVSEPRPAFQGITTLASRCLFFPARSEPRPAFQGITTHRAFLPAWHSRQNRDPLSRG